MASFASQFFIIYLFIITCIYYYFNLFLSIFDADILPVILVLDCDRVSGTMLTPYNLLTYDIFI